ncbi:hypothetical protein [Micromonospora sp. WMMD714]|uniref:hypothetical protein n=1 Tax=Micromonospora sp. WMMD714 TaxID=3016097 RepID=UPI00249B6B42|nr:hypothetical protein [Micromonospora sp. WMMD714]WFE63564.1 hypothetical protein O7625_09835 [Micromonospora sp. WMMD714]
MPARRLLLLPAVTVLCALAACGATEQPSSAPTTAAPASASPVASSAGPTTAAPTAPADRTPSATSSATSKAAGDVKSAACPSGATLEKLVELPKGMTFGRVDCVKDWAGADPQGPKTGDGIYLFHHTAGTGWKYYGEGSGYDCKDLGLTEPAPFCISD